MNRWDGGVGTEERADGCESCCIRTSSWGRGGKGRGSRRRWGTRGRGR